MKTSFIGKKPGRLAEGEENSCMSTIKKTIKPSSKSIFSYFYGSSTFLDEAMCITYLEVKRSKAMLWSTDI